MRTCYLFSVNKLNYFKLRPSFGRLHDYALSREPCCRYNDQMSEALSKEIFLEFVAESEEQCQRVSSNLGLMEKGQGDDKTIDSVYRDMHTMKGSALLFGYDHIVQVTHAMETSLEPLRNQTKSLEPDFVDTLYRCLDLIGEMLKDLTPEGAQADFSSQVETLLPKLGGASKDEVVEEPVGEEKNDIKVEAVEENPEEQVVESSTVEEAPATKEVSVKEQEKSESALESGDTTVRVKVDLLDKLMNLVGELVLVRNQVLQHSRRSDDMEFLNLSQNLDIVTSDLQGEVMKTRMQPIGHILNKYQRVIRDIARNLGKKIDLNLIGVDTELDKTLLEAVKDPLTHIIRNSCDHGIETPEERKAAGKSPTGEITIRAFHEGGQVVVEINDNGRGLSREKIIAKAIDKNIITPAQGSKMGDREAFNLIFAPGFSTAEKISNVSGRGVGMDVVRTNIEKIGGSVDLNSELGKGTQISLKIPLTLAIVPAMIVRTGKDTFAIPQVKLVELVRVENEEASEVKVEFLQGKPVFRLRGDLLPLVSLGEVLGQHSDNQMDFTQRESINIVVLNAEDHCFGLVVDEILDTADIVVKPLSQFLKMLSVFSGATIMGDGSVALILDVQGISQRTHVESLKESSERVNFGAGGEKEKGKYTDAQEFLVFRVNAKGKYSMPLCLVNRLEEFSVDQIEYSGKQRVVRYRGAILPLISLNRALGFEETENKGENISVVVTEKQGRRFGIEVDQIEDVIVIEQSIDDGLKDREGIYGNIVCDDEVVVVVDVLSIMDREIDRLMGTKPEQKMVVHNGGGNGQNSNGNGHASGSSFKILLAEDTPFFRRQILKVLTRAGHQVVAVEDGKKALDKLMAAEEGEFKLVVSDIEMPEMTGFELATEVRKNSKLKDMPMIAVTSRYQQKDIENGKEVGFNLYLEKLNEEKLLNGINSLLKKGA